MTITNDMIEKIEKANSHNNSGNQEFFFKEIEIAVNKIKEKNLENNIPTLEEMASQEPYGTPTPKKYGNSDIQYMLGKILDNQIIDIQASSFLSDETSQFINTLKEEYEYVSSNKLVREKQRKREEDLHSGYGIASVEESGSMGLY